MTLLVAKREKLVLTSLHPHMCMSDAVQVSGEMHHRKVAHVRVLDHVQMKAGFKEVIPGELDA